MYVLCSGGKLLAAPAASSSDSGMLLYPYVLCSNQKLASPPAIARQPVLVLHRLPALPSVRPSVRLAGSARFRLNYTQLLAGWLRTWPFVRTRIGRKRGALGTGRTGLSFFCPRDRF